MKLKHLNESLKFLKNDESIDANIRGRFVNTYEYNSSAALTLVSKIGFEVLVTPDQDYMHVVIPKEKEDLTPKQLAFMNSLIDNFADVNNDKYKSEVIDILFNKLEKKLNITKIN